VKIKSGILDPDAMIASSFFADDAKIGKWENLGYLS
jgi:hypothetical protein